MRRLSVRFTAPWPRGVQSCLTEFPNWYEPGQWKLVEGVMTLWSSAASAVTGFQVEPGG
jgi:hypothetical protein